jgi:hypothetical protein
MVRIAMMKALNHGRPNPATTPRRKRATAYRIVIALVLSAFLQHVALPVRRWVGRGPFHPPNSEGAGPVLWYVRLLQM